MLGSQVADWLATQQIQAMTLLGRSGRLAAGGPGSTSSLDVMASSSPIFRSLVTMAAGDVSVYEGVEEAVQTNVGRTLHGILHAAGVLVDGTLASQRLKGLQDVLGPKANAALRLQTQALSRPVAFQVLFSSVAALLGSPGQANYSAANSLLDALAGAAHQAGCVATSVQWGAWAGAGMAAGDTTTASRVERTGMALLLPAQGLSILEGMLIAPKPSTPSVVAANAFVWSKFLNRFGANPPSLFNEFVQEGAVGGEATQAGVSRTGAAAALAGVSPEERKAAVDGQVKDAVRSILGVDVSPDEPLMAAGLDSLGAVELKNALEGRMGMQLPGTLVFDYPTVAALSEHLHSQLPAMVAKEAEVSYSQESGVPVELSTTSQHQLVANNGGFNALALTGVSTRSATPGSILSIHGVDAIAPVPLERWDLEVLSRSSMSARFGGFLPFADQFDISLFGLSMTEAELMDAQQRILLEGSYEVRD